MRHSGAYAQWPRARPRWIFGSSGYPPAPRRAWITTARPRAGKVAVVYGRKPAAEFASILELVREAALVLDLLTSAYRLDLEDAAYLRELVSRAVPLLDRGLGVASYTYDARDPSRPVMQQLAMSGTFQPGWLSAFYNEMEKCSSQPSPRTHPTGFESWARLSCAQVSQIPAMREMLPLFSHFGGARDVFALNALDASGRGLWLGAPWPRATRASKERETLFTRVAAHLTTAQRLRRQAPDTPRPTEAVLSPEGNVLHAEDVAKGTDARTELRRAATALERARTREGRRNVELATRQWKPLVLSRWSMLDEFDSDGRRYIVAVDNRAPTAGTQPALSEREHQVLTHALLGHTNKVIAYELGLSDSTVRVLFHRAALKLDAKNRRDTLERYRALVETAKPADPPLTAND